MRWPSPMPRPRARRPDYGLSAAVVVELGDTNTGLAAGLVVVVVVVGVPDGGDPGATVVGGASVYSGLAAIGGIRPAASAAA